MRLIKLGGTLLAIGWLLWVWQFLMTKPIGVDTQAYWLVDANAMYWRAMSGVEPRFVYSPIFGQLIVPLTYLPWEIFNGLWLATSMSALVFMLGPIGAAVVLLVPTSPVWWELSAGNIHLMLAAAVVLSFRHPAAWSFVLLTKVTPGVGLLWFVMRRQWKSVAIVSAATVAVISISVVIGGTKPWAQWLSFLATGSRDPGPYSIAVPLLVRLPLAACIVAIGAWRGWPWVVPVAAMLALPMLWMWHSFSMLVGALALIGRSETARMWIVIRVQSRLSLGDRAVPRAQVPVSRQSEGRI
jgi:hypothetical protein